MTLNSATIQLAQQIQNQSLTTFSKFIAVIADPLILIALALILSIYLYLKKQKSKAILLALTSIITGAIIKIIKQATQISRPDSMLIQETSYAFPSGHTTFAVIFFGLLAYIFSKPKYKIPATVVSIILILTISFTRLYLQVHWLTDIIGGLIIGTVILIFSILAHKKFTSNK